MNSECVNISTQYIWMKSIVFSFMHLADRFYPAIHIFSGYTYFCQYMCSLKIEPTTFALLTQSYTTEPQELFFRAI